MNYQPRSTNPYIMEKKLNECVGGGLDPSVLEEIEAEISILGSQNKTQAQDITDIKGSLNSINDNLTQQVYLDRNASTLETLIDSFIASSANTLNLGQTKQLALYNNNNLYFNTTITRYVTGNYYNGIAISILDGSIRYTFSKIGGASTVISSF